MGSLHRSCVALGLLLTLAAAAASGLTVAQVPSPRPDGWVVDLTGTLPLQTLTDLNRLGDEVKARTGAELAVLVIPTTGGDDPHEFATRLFNTWGIGQLGKNNGVLLFVALDDHAVEIVLGDGLDHARGTQASQAILQGNMIPRFRQGDPAGAILEGARACAWQILELAPAPTAAAPPATAPEAAHPFASPPEPVTAQPFASEPAPAGDVPWAGFLVALGLMGAAGAGIWLLVRNPRCSHCRAKMVMLDEAADDADLQPSERVEERIGSVDHQVWICPGCGQKTRRRYARFFSGYESCPGCSARTLVSKSNTLRAATYDHGGAVRVDESCMSCSHSHSYTYSTACLERPTDNSSSSSAFGSSSRSSSGFSSSGSSSSSSSSSSGSSFGGGHSSGGGASGRW